MAKSKHSVTCRRLSAPLCGLFAALICLFLTGGSSVKSAEKGSEGIYKKPSLGLENALPLSLSSVGACAGVSALLPLSPIEAGGYSASPLAENIPVSEACKKLDETLAAYPAGFFDKLTEGTGGLVFALTGSISASEGLPEPSAFTADRMGGVLIVLDVSSGLSPSSVYHELCHAIDRRLSSLAEAGGSWSEENWLALCPRGFSYYNAYSDEAGAPLAFAASPLKTAESAGSVYFINRYSKTFPTEDRAVLFETLMRAVPEAPYMQSPHIIMKLSYYFAAIRFCLDPDGSWTEPTFWEAKLNALCQ